MKKLIVILLSLPLVFSLSACGSTEGKIDGEKQVDKIVTNKGDSDSEKSVPGDSTSEDSTPKDSTSEDSASGDSASGDSASKDTTSEDSASEDSISIAATKTAIGGVVSAEIPEGWKLVTGDEACGDSSFDFVYCSDSIFTNYFTIIRDTQEVDHYKEMIGTGNYGKDLGTAELGEGKWYIAEKVAAGPIGEDTCVIQTYDCDLSSEKVQAVLASLKWIK